MLQDTGRNLQSIIGDHVGRKCKENFSIMLQDTGRDLQFTIGDHTGRKYK